MVRTFHYCDRCGVEISNKQQDVVFRGRRNEDDSMEVCDVIELCSDCEEKLFNWLITPDKDEPAEEQIKEATVKEPAEESNGILDERINILELPVRTHDYLLRTGINTVGKLCDLTEDALWLRRGIGKRSIKHIKKALEERGLSLKEVK